MFSFIKDGILYQVIASNKVVLKILFSVYSKPPKFPHQSQIALTIGGSLWSQSFASPCRLDGKKFNEKGHVRDVSPESTKPTEPAAPTAPTAPTELRPPRPSEDGYEYWIHARVSAWKLGYSSSAVMPLVSTTNNLI
jgi:hypothetical protein